MVCDAVAIAPEGSEITIETVSGKSGASSVHAEFIAAANAEISKAVLGQTLTTEIGDKGSYAAALAHNLVREDLAAADRRRIAAAFNRLAAVWCFYNFGADVAPPQFEFVQDEDLQMERAERDVKLHAVGWRPSRAYFMREYNMGEDDFALAQDAGASGGAGFARDAGAAEFAGRGAGCSCGRGRPAKKRNVFTRAFRRLLSLFASKEEKQAERDDGLMREFEGAILVAGQRQTDAMIDVFVDALGAVETFEDAPAALAEAYGKLPFAGFAHVMDEARFAASGIGYGGAGNA
jgi:phage gp29-like protein